METKCEKPIRFSSAQSRTEAHSAPDCEMKAMSPSLGPAGAKLAFRLSRGTMMPRQLGPTIRMPSNRACSARICRSSLRPASPVSLKPAETTIRPRMPASPHAATCRGTSSAGEQMMARSACLGRCATSG